MSSLLDSVKAQITPDVIQHLASTLGESAGSVQTALQTGGVAMLTALASKAADTGFLGQIMSLVKNFSTTAIGSGASAMGAAAGAGAYQASTAGAYAGGASTAAGAAPGPGGSLLTMLFGNNISAITSKIAEVSGLHAGSAGTILASAAPMVLSALSSKVQSGGLTTTGLGNMLSSELPSLRSMLPAGLALPGMAGVSAAAAHMRDSMNDGARAIAPEKRSSWLGPAVIIGILLLGGLIWYFNRNKTVDNSSVTPASVVTNAASTAAAGLGAFAQTSLPDGVVLNIPQNGVENKLLTFIKDPNAQVSQDTWFDFDRLLFDTNSTALQPSSQEQLQNIASILKAYPSVHLRIGGYTDNQGDKTANMKLSEDRADNVKQALVGLGVDPSRLDAKGYGEDHPIADNTSDAGRSMNRRISMRVTQK